MAVSGGVAIASVLALEYGIARATHAGAQAEVIAMLLGAMVAMMGSMALTATSMWARVRTAAFFPVALGAGMAAGVAVGSHTDLMLAVFVVVMFAAVIVRRFGMPFFFYGFQLWMGYFFASFTHATAATLPSLLVTVITASAWILLLAVTVLRGNPRRTLARIRRAFDARSRDVARMSAALLEAAVTDPSQVSRWRRRLTARQARLAEAALMIEAWSAETGALPAGWSAVALRRHLLDAQLAIDGIAAAAGDLAGSRDTDLIVEAAGIAGLVAGREYGAAGRAAGDLLGRDGGATAYAATHDVAVHDAAARTAAARDAAARRAAAEDATATDGTVTHATVTDAAWLAAQHLAASTAQFVAVVGRAGDQPGADAPDEFEPAVSLAMGNLPGSVAFASVVAPRGRRWNPLTRLDFISRQAVQAAVAGGLAILIGREISTTRYYWAVLAAFIAFSGTATRSETSIKAANRVLGTLVGLFAGLALAHVTSGHTMWILAVVVASMSAGLYLMRISYRYMIFFITIMIAQLYSVLHELSDGLLMLRLEETAVGAAIGIVVALVLAPLSTRDVVATVRSNLFTALADLLRATGDHLDGERDGDGSTGSRHDLDALIRGVDIRLYQLLLAAAPLTRPLVWGNSPRRTRHRLTLYSASAHYARDLAVAVRDPVTSPYAAGASRALADAVTAMADAQSPVEARRSAALAHLDAADAALFGRPDPSGPAASTAAQSSVVQSTVVRSSVVRSSVVQSDLAWGDLARADALRSADMRSAAVPSAATRSAVRALVHLHQLLREVVTFALPEGPARAPALGAASAPAPGSVSASVSGAGLAPVTEGASEPAPSTLDSASPASGPAPSTSEPASSTSEPAASTLEQWPSVSEPGRPAFELGRPAFDPAPEDTAAPGTGRQYVSATAATRPPAGPVSHRRTATARPAVSSAPPEPDDAADPTAGPRHAVRVEGDPEVSGHRRRRGLSRHAR